MILSSQDYKKLLVGLLYSGLIISILSLYNHAHTLEQSTLSEKKNKTDKAIQTPRQSLRLKSRSNAA